MVEGGKAFTNIVRLVQHQPTALHPCVRRKSVALSVDPDAKITLDPQPAKEPPENEGPLETIHTVSSQRCYPYSPPDGGARLPEQRVRLLVRRRLLGRPPARQHRMPTPEAHQSQRQDREQEHQARQEEETTLGPRELRELLTSTRHGLPPILAPSVPR